MENLNQGLYNGTSGIALMLAEGIGADLLEDSEMIREYIQKCFETNIEELDLADGVAGKGIALLQCHNYLAESTTRSYLDNCILQLLRTQKKDGSWDVKSPDTGKQNHMLVGLSHGITGIIYFLLEYNSRYENQEVRHALNRSLIYLSKRTQNLIGLFIPSVYQKLLDNRPEIGDERTSAILCFIQAYESLEDEYFKEAAETALYQFPDFVVNSNFTQDGGMAALGELYLEAWRVFNNEEWKNRAHQIISVLLHTKYRSNTNNCYWLTDETRKPVADLLVGNSGIIHFLLRCIDPFKLGHILLR